MIVICLRKLAFYQLKELKLIKTRKQMIKIKNFLNRKILIMTKCDNY